MAGDDTIFTDDQLAEIFNSVDFSRMVTADDVFYLIARAVEKAALARIREGNKL
jgi:hypothetical protein